MTDDLLIIEREKRLVQQLTGTGLSRIVLNNVGWTSRVYIIDSGRLVIKFPRNKEVKKEYQQEVAILKVLEQLKTNIQVPKLRWTHPQNDYIGYEGVVGQALDIASRGIKFETKQTIGLAIGTFLKQLHDLEFSGGTDMSLEAEIKEFQFKYELGLNVMQQEFTAVEQAEVKDLIYKTMPSELHRFGARRTVCHGDLGYWNIVLKEDDTVGIIDFGDVGHYDHSKDFIGLQEPVVLNAALEAYGDDDILRQKIAIRQKVLPVLDIPFYEGKQNAEGLKRTLNNLRENLELINR